MIYFIECMEARAVKIGFCKADPRTRLGALQVQSPHVLTILGVIDGDLDTERSIHQALADLKIRGEWFRDGEQVRAVLAMGDVAAMHFGPPKVKADHATIHVSRELRRRLRSVAHEEGRTTSAQAEWFIERALDARERKGRKP